MSPLLPICDLSLHPHHCLHRVKSAASAASTNTSTTLHHHHLHHHHHHNHNLHAWMPLGQRREQSSWMQTIKTPHNGPHMSSQSSSTIRPRFFSLLHQQPIKTSSLPSSYSSLHKPSTTPSFRSLSTMIQNQPGKRSKL
jgi:hypothetical protein